ncbi:hypothetical protein CDL15_Pgr006274 [Punica granatum]|nr:hypothetical protein CDL15_Pgr006274 [Punica granatum]
MIIQLSSLAHSRKLMSLYEPPKVSLKYHHGVLLEGDLAVSILWYGKFTPAQKSIISDFLVSLNAQKSGTDNVPSSNVPSVAKWWGMVQAYLREAAKREARVTLGKQLMDEGCSMGRLLTRAQVAKLAQKVNSGPHGLALVMTSDDVAVEDFCMGSCGFHGGDSAAFVWVGNSATQCPGQCAWPFHQPIYGPQVEPLGAPNGNVGADGMVINVASLLAGAVTNPFGGGYFVGEAGALPLEAASACAGSYGKGAYPGYAGELLKDPTTGASYNAVGVNGRKYLLPALFDPATSQCTTLV